ncbi:hypothetical protein TNIN_451401 [Trichonephila inaurata madagascariensis]|uniref:Uncharacterized protein n=1 Tax=Trichonephila inaurata madagascariensis TaxID=2747483 RepID=A0A8X6YYN0_9ARAC|nr:hypothetical protein TNIN_451401 [Trichonephila inaurata madagascariensis]
MSARHHIKNIWIVGIKRILLILRNCPLHDVRVTFESESPLVLYVWYTALRDVMKCIHLQLVRCLFALGMTSRGPFLHLRGHLRHLPLWFEPRVVPNGGGVNMCGLPAARLIHFRTRNRSLFNCGSRLLLFPPTNSLRSFIKETFYE